MKKGFTIVELLAVIVIISLLLTLTGVSITKIVKKSKQNLNEIQKTEIINAAKSYMAHNMGIDILDNECKYITLYKLKENGYIENVNNYENIYIKIELENSELLNNYKYTIVDSIDNCIEID